MENYFGTLRGSHMSEKSLFRSYGGLTALESRYALYGQMFNGVLSPGSSRVGTWATKSGLSQVPEQAVNCSDLVRTVGEVCRLNHRLDLPVRLKPHVEEARVL